MSGDEDMAAYSCADVEERAAELGLGVLGGAERAAALAHMEGCPRCSALVDDMAAVGDGLLQLAPEAEPPPGFEARLLARLERRVAPGEGPADERSEEVGGAGPATGPAGDRGRGPAGEGAGRSRRRRWAAIGAAAAAAAAAVAVGVSLSLPPSSGFQVRNPSTVAALGGQALWAGALRRQGTEVGQLFAYQGRPSWVFMTVDAAGAPRALTCELVMAGGRKVDLGTFSLAGGYGSWGSTVGVAPGAIASVRLVTPSGAVFASGGLAGVTSGSSG